jgi:hypothetical protein
VRSVLYSIKTTLSQALRSLIFHRSEQAASSEGKGGVTDCSEDQLVPGDRFKGFNQISVSFFACDVSDVGNCATLYPRRPIALVWWTSSGREHAYTFRIRPFADSSRA